ncbi:MAG TPA: hypothetical protein VKB59_15245 [Micromonosporaceae bacterium]|nr:hypothetical protein [Micromonosporaceae bacterium]
MPERTDSLTERMSAAAGLASLVGEARATWLSRAERGLADRADEDLPDGVDGASRTPRWRAFEDAFPTFYQFTNRPRG